MSRSNAGTFLCGAFVLLSSGCAVVKAIQQPEKKNVSVLSPGVPRSRVVAELGAPVHSSVRGGVHSDVFAFKQGYTKPVKAGRAVAHGAADFMTFGLWEVVGTPTEMLLDGTDVKVEVAYDTNEAVQSVTFFEGEQVMRERGLSTLFKRRSATPQPAAAPPLPNVPNLDGQVDPLMASGSATTSRRSR